MGLLLGSTPSFVYALDESSGDPINGAGGANLINPGGANAPTQGSPNGGPGVSAPDTSAGFNAGGTTYFAGPAMSANDIFDLAQGDFTIEAWIFDTGGPGLYRDIMRVNYSGSGQYILRLSDASNTLEGFNGGLASSGAQVPGSTWTHVAFVRTGSSGQLYINGVASGAAVGGQVNGSGFSSISLHVGLASGGGERWNGNMAWLAGYKSALSSTVLLSHATY